MRKTVIPSILSNAHIPALSVSLRRGKDTGCFAGGVTDTSNPTPVDALTLFQAASLSKPVSAAIVLELIRQGRLWDLDTPLAAIGTYGSSTMQADPRYSKLTTRMVLGQCSGLPNWFYEGKPETFIAEPGDHFTYSGVAFQCLKELIENKLGTTWEALAQQFFQKIGMRSSTFKPPYAGLVARAHLQDGRPAAVVTEPNEILAGSLMTTAEDYMLFLQHCYTEPFLRSTLFLPHTTLEKGKHPEIENAIKWGLGMGIYTQGENTIAFHWGSNTGSYAFCAINLKTGDAAACFINSENAPVVFDAITKHVVADMRPVFQWLSNCAGFTTKVPVESPEVLDALTRSLPTMLREQEDALRDKQTVGTMQDAGFAASQSATPRTADAAAAAAATSKFENS